MTLIEQRPESRRDGSEWAHRRAVWTAAGGFALLLVAFWAWWPAGVVLGLVVGVLAVLRIGRSMHAAAQSEPVADDLSDIDGELWQEFRRLRVRLGDDWADFSAAAVLVTREQTASAALLGSHLGVPTAQAQHLLQLLEREGFVGPSRGVQPRLVRVDRERAGELQELLQA